MTNIFLETIWPPSLAGKIARILGALSVIGLVRYGLNFGIGPTLSVLLTYYDRLLEVTLSWSEPLINFALYKLQTLFGWPLELQSHWKHLFVLMGIYFFRGVGIELQARLPVTAIFILILGAMIALSFSVAAGIVASTPSDFGSNFLIASIPVFGAGFVFPVLRRAWRATFLRAIDAELLQVQPTWWAVFKGTVFRATLRTAFGIVFICATLLLPPVRALPSPGVFIFAVLIFLLAFYWIAVGIKDARRLRGTSERWTEGLVRTDAGQLGCAMLGVFFWVSVFLALNAGLGFWGL